MLFRSDWGRFTRIERKHLAHSIKAGMASADANRALSAAILGCMYVTGVDTLSTEAMGKVKVGVGMPVETLRDISKSYREANLALTIGGIFKPTEDIMRYDNLGLGRLIYQLPPTLCQMFLDEVFEDKSYEQLDQEIINTIDTFFECDLNGSETSRKLFVHRNTLVYRLDKVQKITGLDVRTFEDAVLFKLASMVKKYLDYLENKSKLASEDKWWRT